MNMTRNKRDPKKVALAQAIIDAYNPNSVEDMNDALKDLFGPLFESMLQGEMNNHQTNRKQKKWLHKENT